MLITTISAIVFIIMGIIIYKHVKRGYKRGVSFSLISLSTVLFSVFFGALISIAIVSSVTDSVIEMLSEYPFYDSFVDTVMGFEGVIVLVFQMVATLVIYIPVFSLLRLIVGIVTLIVKKKLSGSLGKSSTDYHKEDEELYVKRQRIIGASVGALTGFIISLVMLMPLVGCIKSADAVIDFVEELSGTEADEDNEIIGSLHKFSDDIAVNIVDACGGRMIFNFATTVGGYGGYTSFNRELKALSEIDIEEVTELFATIGTGEDAKAALESLIDRLGSSAAFEIILVDSISGASAAWLNNSDYLGVPRPSFGNYNAIDTFLDELLYVCSSTDRTTIRADLRTLVGISSILAEKQEMFSDGDYDTIIADFVSGGLIKELKAELQKNSHMYTVAYALDSLVMAVVAEEIQNTVKYSSEACEALFDEIASILSSTSDLSSSVRVSAVSESIRESLEEYGMQVPEELNEQIAQQLIEGVEDFDGEVRYEQVQEYFEQFLAGGGNISDYLPDGTIPEGIIPDGYLQ